ncbi:hypothetical protein DVH24_017245 [Malus domestica]|uniref:TF-B3 domain-containing protein n=1 Tax=Malus domestica TaxID=3750 RepID=A0A498IWP0_MALDO|nr:hypothetical protein DVH24_017245 [Malus domestica]
MEFPSQSDYHSYSVANSDGLKSSFDSRLVIEEMTSKQDMESNREVEVVQWTTKMKTQVPLSSSGEALICNVGLQSVSYGVCGTCRTTRCGVRLQREEIIPGDSSPFTSSFYNVHKLTLTGQSTSTSCSWDAGFRERQGVSLESERGKGARKCGLAEGNDSSGHLSFVPHLTMENFHPPSVPSTMTVTSTHQTNNSQSSTCEPMSCLPSTTCSPSATQYRYYPELLYARNYYPYHQAGLPMYPFLGGAQPNMVLSREQASLDRSGWILNALMSKSARNERKMARQRSLSLSRNAANTAVSCSPPVSRHPPFHGNHDDDTCGIISTSSSGNGADLQNTKEQLYPFCTPDNKKLRPLFNKELKNSDVGPLGRIIVPKKEAENNLPMLSGKEGIQLTVRDVHSDQHWEFKYKYWSNNRSRMYVFEYTGAFVRQKRLEAGDCIYLYEDECKNIYVYVEKVPRPAHVAEPSSSSQQRNTTTNHTDQTANMNTSLEANNTDNKTPNTDAKTHRSNPYVASNLSSPSPSPFTYVAGYEEDELSLELLMEQLKQEQEANVFADALSMMSVSSSAYMEHEEATTLSNNIANRHIETSTKPPSTLSAGIDPSSSSSSQSRAMVRMVNDDQPEFDDCYKGLGTLPEVDHYKYV